MKKAALLIVTLSILIFLTSIQANYNYDIFIKINFKTDIDNLIKASPFIMPLMKMKNYYIALIKL